MSGYEVKTLSVPTGGDVTVMCTSGKKVLGGGYADGNSVQESHPTAGNDGWVVKTQSNQTVTAYAICANVQP